MKLGGEANKLIILESEKEVEKFFKTNKRSIHCN